MVFSGQVQSLLFDGANSAVLLNEERSGFEFRVALPQTGQFADLKVGERIAFGFDPQRAICFTGVASGIAASQGEAAAHA
jgi:spermidine/putrescine transport system ATP-binding protein